MSTKVVLISGVNTTYVDITYVATTYMYVHFFTKLCQFLLFVKNTPIEEKFHLVTHFTKKIVNFKRSKIFIRAQDHLQKIPKNIL